MVQLIDESKQVVSGEVAVKYNFYGATYVRWIPSGCAECCGGYWEGYDAKFDELSTWCDACTDRDCDDTSDDEYDAER